MPRLLIAGCGYLGQAIADLFVAAGWEVEGWTMTAESAQQLSNKGFSARAVDLAAEDQVRARGANFDAVIHAASTRGGDADSYRRVYLEGSRNLLRDFKGTRFLFVSSTSVYAQTGGEEVTEESPAAPRHETGNVLRQAEELVLSGNGIVVRLAGIYGPGRSALLRKFLNQEAILDPAQDRFVNAIHRDDAAVAVALLVQREGLAGGVLNVVDDEPWLRSDCYKWLAAKLSRPLPPTGKSVRAGKRGESNKRVSNAKLRALGWTLRYPNFAIGMEKSVLPALERFGA